MSGFTPGPWVASHNSHYWEFGQEGTIHHLGDVCATGVYEKGLGYGSEPDDLPVFSGTAEANAHLIAAAPEMYEALVRCHEELMSVYHSEYDGVWFESDFAELEAPYLDVLRKARGEDQ